jgi:predicted transcriptional regulator
MSYIYIVFELKIKKKEMAANKQKSILDYLKENPCRSSKEIFDSVGSNMSYAPQ